MDISRRRFLKTLTVTGSALAIAPAPARAETSAPAAAVWTVVGKTADFALEHTPNVILPPDAGSDPPAVTHAPDGKFSALSAACTHRGCTVDWADDTKQSVCPCHRGRFDAQGKVLAGPPRRPQPAYAARANADGTLSVQASAFIFQLLTQALDTAPAPRHNLPIADLRGRRLSQPTTQHAEKRPNCLAAAGART